MELAPSYRATDQDRQATFLTFLASPRGRAYNVPTRCLLLVMSGAATYDRMKGLRTTSLLSLTLQRHSLIFRAARSWLCSLAQMALKSSWLRKDPRLAVYMTNSMIGNRGLQMVQTWHQG